MAPKTSLSRTRQPPAVSGLDLPNLDQLNALAGGFVPLGSTIKPQTGVWPAANASGPLTANLPITETLPSITGMRLVKWTDRQFNAQSDNWVPVPAQNGIVAGRVCANVTTNRGDNYANTGVGFPCHLNFGTVSDTTRLIVAYMQTTTHAANQSVFNANHEVQIWAEREGRLDAITEMPSVWPAGSGGDRMYYKEITFAQARSREFDILLSAGCWLEGIYIDEGAQITPSPNKIHDLSHGDSWAEGAGNVWGGANSQTAGVAWPGGCSLLYSNTAIQRKIHTGWNTTIAHQGGTGYLGNLNSGISEDNTTTKGFTSFLSQNQLDFEWPKWGVSGPPIVSVHGGWNDGFQTTAVYQARALKVYRKVFEKNPATILLVEGIQNKTVSKGDGRDTANTGLKNAVAILRAEGYNIWFIDNLADANYRDIGTPGGLNMGGDGIHPTVKGGNLIGANWAKRISGILVPRSAINAMLSAPIKTS